MYRSVLAGKRVLVVLDNARDVWQVRPLLPGAQGCLVIATSRNPLTGLAMTDGARLLTLKLPSVSTARETLERRLGADRVAAEPEAVEEIIRLCGQLPLALAIVSARAAHPGFTLASISAELQRTQSRLDALGPAGVAADARTVFSWSYHHLSPRACRLFRLLSLHPAADITAAASASLLGASPDEANRLMAELANTSLLSEDRPGRYSFHDLIRAYAAELLASTDLEIDRQTAPARLLDHYLHSVHAALLAVKPHRRLTAPGPPRPGVTPEQFTDYRSAMSWFISERRVLNAVSRWRPTPTLASRPGSWPCPCSPSTGRGATSTTGWTRWESRSRRPGGTPTCPVRGTCSEAWPRPASISAGPPTASDIWSGRKPPTGNSGTPPSTPIFMRSSDRSSSGDGGAGGQGT